MHSDLGRRAGQELADADLATEPAPERPYIGFERLERRAPIGVPVSVNHALTYGWLCGELVRRISGRSVGRFFAEEVADPLGLEIWIGLPEEHERRVATLELWPTWPAAEPLLRYPRSAQWRRRARSRACTPI